METPAKSQPWKAVWPPADQNNSQNANNTSTVEYGVAQGGIVVVDGTAANVRPSAAVRLDKTQPWKASWTAHQTAAPTNGSVDYGVAQGDTVVVDGTAANVKPTARVQA